jgi:hypothetical protein
MAQVIESVVGTKKQLQRKREQTTIKVEIGQVKGLEGYESIDSKLHNTIESHDTEYSRR